MKPLETFTLQSHHNSGLSKTRFSSDKPASLLDTARIDSSSDRRQLSQITDRIALGRVGESLALDFLLGKGFKLLDRNWRSSLGELDLVLESKTEFVFVEVKTRTGKSVGSPLEAITEAKHKRLRQLSQLWRKKRAEKLGIEALAKKLSRIDVVAVTLGLGAPIIDHLERI